MFEGLGHILDFELAEVIGNLGFNVMRILSHPLGISVGGHMLCGLDFLLGIFFANMGIWFIHHFFIKNGD